MTVTAYDDSTNIATGYFYLNDLIEATEVLAIETITADLEPYFSQPSNEQFGITWTVTTQISAFNPLLTQTYGGTPIKRRYGTFTYNQSNLDISQTYVNYTTQSYEYVRSWSSRYGIPDVEFVPPPVGDAPIASIRPVLAYYATVGRVATGFTLDLEPGVVANCIVAYSSQRVRTFPQPTAQFILWYNG